MRPGLVRVVGLEDMGRRGVADGLQQFSAFLDYRHLVLGAGQRHALRRTLRKGDPGHLADALGQHLVGQRLQGASRWRLPWRKEGEGTGGLRPQVLQQPESIRLGHVGRPGDEQPLPFLGQQVVEVPLHGTFGGPVDVHLGLQR
ncbi:hypothetical protein D3C81_1582130 [compost metagenome]